MTTAHATAHVSTYILRGFGYALTSASAMLSGYLMQTTGPSRSDLLMLSIPVALSIFFFICYANRFHYQSAQASTNQEIQIILEREALYIYPIIGILYSIIVLVSHPLSMNLIIAFLIYVILFIVYGVFLLLQRPVEGLPLIRHQLVWPVVLSIGIGLYYGLSFTELHTSLVPLFPVGILVVWYSICEAFNWSAKVFVRVNLALVLGITIFLALTLTGILPVPILIRQYVFSFFFCLSAAAYLAVFEAWRITADIAQRNPELDREGTRSIISKSSQYSIATLTALLGSVWVLPFYFIFSRFGTFFLISFALHAMAAFGFWYHYGKEGHLRRNLRWIIIKNIAGFLFLALMVVASKLNKQPSSPFMKGFASWEGLFFLFGIASFLLVRLGYDLRRLASRKRRPIILRLLEKRLNFVRILCWLCWIACFIILTLLEFQEETSLVYYKGQLAFCVYAAFIILCGLFELFSFMRIFPFMPLLINCSIGLLQATRIITSLFITALVVIPAIHKGVESTKAIMCALPFCFAAMGGFALNDYYDFAKDIINKPHRAIPSGKLSPLTVRMIAFVLIIIAVLTAIYVHQSKAELILYFSSILGVTFYNSFVRRFGLYKTIYTAAISTLPLLYDVIALGYSRVYVLVPISALVFLIGREFLLDITDIEGDKLSGITTIPMILGLRSTAIIGFLLQILGVFILFPLALISTASWGFLLISLVSLMIFIMFILWSNESNKLRNRIVLCLWVPMLCGVMLLLV